MTIEELEAERDIRATLYRYCRGIDRRDYELVRSCYHPGAVDDHGAYRGDIDGFVEFLRDELPRFEHTMHVVANVLVELGDGRATSEAYTLAYHRLPARPAKPARDFVVGLRYVDRFSTQGGRWAIDDRRCVFEWGHLDESVTHYTFGPSYLRGAPWPDDPVYRP